MRIKCAFSAFRYETGSPLSKHEEAIQCVFTLRLFAIRPPTPRRHPLHVPSSLALGAGVDNYIGNCNNINNNSYQHQQQQLQQQRFDTRIFAFAPSLPRSLAPSLPRSLARSLPPSMRFL
jgi:hypothetical protein